MTANLYAQSSYKVTVNPNICYQTIADFGSSDCWTADFVGKYFSDAEKEKSAKWLFSQEMDADGNPEGIGLSMWRVNLGAIQQNKAAKAASKTSPDVATAI